MTAFVPTIKPSAVCCLSFSHGYDLGKGGGGRGQYLAMGLGVSHHSEFFLFLEYQITTLESNGLNYIKGTFEEEKSGWILTVSHDTSS